MKLDFHKRFEKQLTKLSPRLQNKVEATTRRFMKDPHDPRLRNHSLKGSMQGLRAVSVTGDVRIVFEEYNNYKTVKFLKIGTHSQVY